MSEYSIKGRRRQKGEWTVKHCQPWRCLYKSDIVRDLRFPEGVIYEDVPWWGELVKPALRYDKGFIDVPNAPGLGIESLNEELIEEKLHPDFPEPWAPTTEWDKEWSNDRQWS